MPATPVSWIPESAVNADPTATQTEPTITQLASGHILVAWTDFNDSGAGGTLGSDIIAQVYDPLGNKVGGEFQLNVQNTSDSESMADIAALPDGGFVVVYADSGADHNISYEQWSFDAATGTAAHETGGIVYDGSTADGPVTGLAVATANANSVMIGYIVEHSGGTQEVLSVVYDPANDTLTSPRSRATSTATSELVDVDVAFDGQRYRLAHVEQGVSSGLLAVGFMNVDGSQGTGWGTGVPGTVRSVSVAGLAGDEWMTTYESSDDVFIQRLGVGPIQVAASEAANFQNEPVIVPLLDGGFVVIWDDEAVSELRAQRYDAAGATVGAIFTVASAPGLTQPAATLLADGRIAVTWHGATNVVMEIFDPRDGANAEAAYGPQQWQIGTPGGDDIVADAASEFVHGWDGDDTITAAGDPREYYGDAGNDTILVTAPLNGDSFSGGAGQDVIDWQLSGLAGAVFNLATGAVTDGVASETISGFDQLNATAGADLILGGASPEILNGVGGDDTINGRYGNDSLHGGPGDDVLRGGFGADTIQGAAGDDVIWYANGDDVDTVDGGSGIDTIDFSAITAHGVSVGLNSGSYLVGTWGTVANVENVIGSQSEDVLEGDAAVNAIEGAGGDDILHIAAIQSGDTFRGGSGSDTIYSSYFPDSVVIDLGAGTFRFGLLPDILDLTSVENATGNIGDDTMTGSAVANHLDGGGGGDVLDGGIAADQLVGGDGDDTLIGGPGGDAIEGGTGLDIADYSDSGQGVAVNLATGEASGGRAYGDTLTAIEGITGTWTADVLTGDAGDNVIDGGAGDDLIEGGAGADVLDGGSGRGDTLSYASAPGTVFVSLEPGGSGVGDAAGDVLTGFENIVGGASFDILAGDSGANALIGGGGDDLLAGGLGADTLDGGVGADAAIYTSAIGPVWINLATGATSGGYAAGDTFVSIEKILGSNFADKLTGDAGNNVLDGLYGDDILNGSNGDDTLLGGASGDDNLTGGAGADLLDGYDGVDTANYSNSDAAVSVSLMSGVATGGHAEGDTFTEIESLFGSAVADTLTGDGNANRLDGFNGDDLLDGGAGGDRINGGNGFDTVTYAASFFGVSINLLSGGGLGGDAEADYVTSVEAVIGSASADRIIGTVGDNLLEGGGGADEFNGSNGDDTILGGDGVDLIVGGAGGDLIDGGNSSDTVYYYNSDAAVTVSLSGGPGSGGHAQGDTFQAMEHVTGSAFADFLFGDSGDNVLNGWLGNDMLNGAAGADFVAGGNGDDYLIGGDGDDFLIGGTSDDVLSGGGGADNFFYGTANFGHDTITSFDNGSDKFNTVVAGLTFADFTATQSGAHTVLSTAAGYTITLLYTDATLIDSTDFVV